MRLVKQVILEHRQGESHKITEIDLVEVGDDQFIVNVRFGRRGKVLRDNSKTPTPLAREAAEAVFQQQVDAKTAKGYQEAGSGFADETQDQAPSAGNDPRRVAVLNRLAEGHASRSHWKLSRAVWRAGELKLKEAEHELIRALGTGDAMLDYSIAWALGQLGGSDSIHALRALEADKNASGTVRRIAGVALMELLQGEEREQTLEKIYAHLPDQLASLARNGPGEELGTELENFLKQADYHSFATMEILYLINNEHCRTGLLQFLAKVRFEPHYFQRVRHIYKAAELRRDAEFLGLLYYRIETTLSSFRIHDASYYRWTRTKRPTFGPNAKNAFSVNTRYYLRKRAWRSLRKLGEISDPDYVKVAVEILLQFTDQDAGPVDTTVRYDWEAYRRSNWRNLQSTTIYYDRFSKFWALNHILYGNSPRYVPDASGRRFACVENYQPGAGVPSAREESFPKLWESQPDQLVRLLRESSCEIVHQFATKALRDCSDYCRELSIDLLIEFLSSRYAATTEFAFLLAVRRYDAENPDTRLVLALADAGFAPARKQAFQWIHAQRQTFFQQSSFIAGLISARNTDTRAFARDQLRQAVLTDALASETVAHVIAELLNLESDDGERARDIGETLLRAFSRSLRRIGSEVIQDLLQSELPEVQEFAGEVVLAHDTLSREPPPEMLAVMLGSDHAAVRSVAVRIVGQLPEHVLKDNSSLLLQLIRHSQPDIRDAIRPVIQKLISSDGSFGRRFAAELVEALLVPGAPEGVPTATSTVLREDFAKLLDQIPQTTVLRLLHSRSAPAQEVGGLLLASNVNPADLSEEDIVKLTDHEILTVRHSACEMCRNDVDRFVQVPDVSRQLMESRWEDTRVFGFDLFKQHFTAEGVLTPDILIAICDSVRPDVQQYGQQLITRVFEGEEGAEYVIKFSEHPSESMQLFASAFLEQHAGDSIEKLRHLAPYFISVLSAVNRGRVAKQRAYQFLAKRVESSKEAAQIVAEIVARQSASVAIGDKSQTIQIMARIHEVYPDIELPIRVQAVEVRNGV